jgi:hypothetical protein
VGKRVCLDALADDSCSRRRICSLAAEGLIRGGGGMRPGRSELDDLSVNNGAPKVAARSSLGGIGSLLSR